jgi:hypothetical protein
VVADRLIVRGEGTAFRRWLVFGDCWSSSSWDGSFEHPALAKYLPLGLINDAAVVDDRFNEATEGMFIVCDLFGMAEVI